MDHQSFMEKQQDTLNEQIRKDPTKLTVIGLAKEFGKPAYRLNCCGIEINKDSKEELKGISHREMFGFINSVLQSRATAIANRVDGLVIPKIADIKRQVDIELHFFKRTSPQWEKALTEVERKIMNEDVKKLSQRICDILSNFSA